MKRNPAKIISTCIGGVMLLALATRADTTNYPNAGTFTWTCPAGVTSVQVQCWGGGGAGGGAKRNSGNTYGGGGGGGAYVSSTVTVVPGTGYTVVVGAGGLHTTAAITATAPAASGSNSSFGGSTVVAAGGNGGQDMYSAGSGTGGTGGQASASTGTAKWSGGSGGTGNSTIRAPGGGSSAGTAANGTSCTTTAGAVAPSGGGNGGNGTTSANGSGSIGGTPGGGGGAGWAYSTAAIGGDGATGKVSLTYTPAYDHVNVETAADGTGSIVSAQNVSSGSSITVYAIARTADGSFLGNCPATWSLVNIQDNVVAGDLLASPDTKSAVFTSRLSGSANIKAEGAYATGTPSFYTSGTITVPATGVTGTWNVDRDGNWSGIDNWSGGVPGAAGDTAIFGVGTSLHTVVLDAPESVGNLTMNNASSFVIAGSSTLTLDKSGNGATIAVISGLANHIQAPLALNDNATIDVSSGKSLSISGNISSTTSKTLTLSGAGTLALSGNNSYGPGSTGITGTTLSGGGTLQLDSSSALGGGDLSVTANSTLKAGANGLSIGNNIALASGVTGTVDTSGNGFSLSGAIGGSGSLSKVGNGTLVLGGASTYSGGTVISAGVVSVSSDGAFGGSSGQLGVVPALATPNNILLNGGVLLGTGTTALQANRGVGIGAISGSTGGTGLIDAASGATFTVNGVIASAGNTGANNLTVNSQVGSSGTVVLNAANTFTGQTVISSGTLTLANPQALQFSTLNYNNQGGVLSFDSLTSAFIAGLTGSQSLDYGNVSLNLGTNNVTSTYSGLLTGTGNLSKSGTGTITLANPGYTGNTVVYNGGFVISGTLNSHLDFSAQQGSVNVTINGSSVTSSNCMYITSPTGGSGTIYGSTATVTITNGAQVMAYAAGNGRAISYGAGNGRPGGNGSLTIGTTGDTTTTVTANGVLDMFYTSGGSTVGNFTVNLNGGTLAVTRIQETTGGSSQSGTFKFNGGVLKALASDSTSPFIPGTAGGFTSPVYAGGAIIDANGYNITIGSVLSHGGGTPDGGLTKLGNGTLTLTNANQYTGITTVKGGTLAINGSYALGGANYGGLTLNGGTLQYTPSFTGNGSGDLSYTTSFGGGITLTASGGTIDVNGNNVTYDNAIGNSGTGGLMVKSTTPGGVLTLSGANSYTGNTTVSSGMLALSASGSLASANITVNTNAKFDVTGLSAYPLNGSGALTLNIAKSGAALTQGQVLATSITAGGTLNVTASGDALAAGDSFTLFTVAPSGTFAATNLPALSAGQNWWTPDNFATLTVNQLTAGMANYTRAKGMSLKIKISDLLSNVSALPSAPADTFTLVSVGASTNGATITTNGSYISFTPANDLSESFTYTVTDARGGSATGRINVSVAGATSAPLTFNKSGNTASFSLFGIPNYTYALETATNLSGPWVPILTNTADAGGKLNFVDPNATNDTQFYRTAQP